MVARRFSPSTPNVEELLTGASCLLSVRAAVPAAGITPAEQRVLALLRTGLSNKEIAAQLGRAEATVKHQVAACLRKHGVSSRARLIALLR